MMQRYARKWSPARYVRGLAHVLEHVSEAIRAVTAVAWVLVLIGTMGFVGVLIWHVTHQ